MALLTLLIAAVSTASSPTMSTPGERPQCALPLAASDDAGAPDDDGDAAPASARSDDTLAGGECVPPPPSPAILDCNDARVTPWLDDMIGRCDMPHGAAPSTVAVARAPRNAGRFVCDSLGCSRGTPPLRPVHHFEDRPRPLVARGLALVPSTGFTRIGDSDEALPASASRDRVERPPRRQIRLS